MEKPKDDCQQKGLDRNKYQKFAKVKFKIRTIQAALTLILIIMALITTPLSTMNAMTVFAKESEDDVLDEDKLREILNSARDGDEDALVDLVTLGLGIESDEEFEEQLGVNRAELAKLIEDIGLGELIKNKIKNNELDDLKLDDLRFLIEKNKNNLDDDLIEKIEKNNDELAAVDPLTGAIVVLGVVLVAATIALIVVVVLLLD